MSSLKQTIRTVLVDVETFLVESLKSVKLNTNAKDQKDRLLEKIRQLLEEIPGSAGSHVDSNASGGSQKISGGGDSSSGSSSTTPRQTTTADDDAGYSDDIAKVAVSDLKNKLQSGLLERKKKSGFKSWEQFYCVVSGNIFYFYKKQTDSKQKEAFCLNGYEFREAPDLDKDTSKKDMCFEVVKAAARSYQFRAGSNEGMMHWREAITKGSQIADDDEPGGQVVPENKSLHYQPLVVSGNNSSPDASEDDENLYDDLSVEPPYLLASEVPRQLTTTSAAQAKYMNFNAVESSVFKSEEEHFEDSDCRPMSGLRKTQEDPKDLDNMYVNCSSVDESLESKDTKKRAELTSHPSSQGQGLPRKMDMVKDHPSADTGRSADRKVSSGTATTQLGQSPQWKKGNTPATTELGQSPQLKKGNTPATTELDQSPQWKKGNTPATTQLGQSPQWKKGNTPATTELGQSPQWKKGNTQATTELGKTPEWKKGNSPATSRNSWLGNTGRCLPSPPSATTLPRPLSQQIQRPPSPSAQGDSPPSSPQGVGVKNLMKMFQQ